MDTVMTRTNFSNSNTEWLREVETIVLDTVNWFRNRGHPQIVAIEQAALALDLSPRKTRSIMYGEPFAVRRQEYDRIFQARMRHLDRQIEDHQQRIEAVRAKRRQMEMFLE